MSSVCDTPPKLPNFKNIFSASLDLLQTKKVNNESYFDIKDFPIFDDVANCFWNLNITELNLQMCSNSTMNLTEACLRLSPSTEKTTISSVHKTNPSTLKYTPMTQELTSLTTKDVLPSSTRLLPDEGAVGRSIQPPSSSNLIGLVALLIIPILCIGIGLFCYFRNRKHNKNLLHNQLSQAPIIATPDIDKGHENLTYLDDEIIDAIYKTQMQEDHTHVKIQSAWGMKVDEKFNLINSKISEGLQTTPQKAKQVGPVDLSPTHTRQSPTPIEPQPAKLTAKKSVNLMNFPSVKRNNAIETIVQVDGLTEQSSSTDPSII